MALDRLLKLNQAKAQLDSMKAGYNSGAGDKHAIDRLLSMNETIVTMQVTEKLCNEYESKIKALNEKIAELEDEKEDMQEMHSSAMSAVADRISAMEKVSGLLETRIKDMEKSEKDSEQDDIKENETLESIKADMVSIMKRLEGSEKGMNRLAEAVAKKSQPVVQTASKAIPKFSFKPVRDQNGDISEVIATPIGG